MKKYISVFIIAAALLMTALAGFGGTAFAGPGDANISLSATSVSAEAGGKVNLTANFTNTSGERFDDYRIRIKDFDIIFDQEDAPLEAGETVDNIPINFTVLEDMLDKELTFIPEYKKNGSFNWDAGQSVKLKINKKAPTIAIKCTVTVNRTQVDLNGEVIFSYVIENQGDVRIENIEVKTDTLIKGKALNPPFPLDPGKSWTVNYKHTFTTPITVNSYITYNVSGSSEKMRYDIPEQIILQQTVRDVKVSFSADDTTPEPGQEVTFTLIITNNGTMTYTGLTVSWNGEDMGFPTKRLNPGDEYEKQYKISFESSTEVTFMITMKDQLGQMKSINCTKQILLPVDPAVLQGGLKLVIEPDRDEFTSAGVVNFSGYIANDSEYTLSDISVTESTLGEIFTVSEMAADTKLPISWSADINGTTTYNFVYSAKDRNGQVYNVNAEPITVTIHNSETTPVNPGQDAVDVTLPPDNASSDPLGIWFIIFGVLVILIIGVGAALVVLWRSGRSPSRPSRPTAAKRPGGGGYSKSIKSRSYRDRNNF